mgnify:CR=1 FL=1
MLPGRIRDTIWRTPSSHAARRPARVAQASWALPPWTHRATEGPSCARVLECWAAAGWIP